MAHKFIDIEYLLQGNPKQKMAYDVIKKLKVMEILKKHGPILAGTIPIDIDIDSSDLDIICEVHHPEEFIHRLNIEFGDLLNFSLETLWIDGKITVLCSFVADGLTLEIFGQPKKSMDQNAYRHMVVENRILEILGNTAKEEIRGLKREGYKTEPAFGVYLNIVENPYEFLLSMYDWDYNQFLEYLKDRRVSI